MSRNKQVDRLEQGLKDNGVLSSTDVYTNIVDYVLKKFSDYKDSDKEVRDLFIEIYNTLISYGYRESTIITRGTSSDISLGQMGFVNTNPELKTTQQRCLLLVILWYIIGDLKDKIHERDYNIQATLRKNDNNIDFLHSEILRLGLWDVDEPFGENTFKDMVNHFVEKYSKLIDDVCYYKAELGKQIEVAKSLSRKIEIKDTIIDKQSETIKELTKELKAQTAATKQFKRELFLLREDDIRLAISGD